MNMTYEEMGNAVAVEAVELTAEEMDEVTGGYKKPADKKGYQIYQIQKGDTLIGIANKYSIKDWKKILEWNPKITNPRLIHAGDYLYIKA